MTKYYSLVMLLFFYNAMSAESRVSAHTIHLPTSDIELKKSGAIKVLSGVSDNGPKIYSDPVGNAIVFAITNFSKNEAIMQSTSKSGNKSIKPPSASSMQARRASTLTYSVFVSSRQKWLAQQYIKLPKTWRANHIVQYELINAHSNSNNILLVTSKGHERTKVSKDNSRAPAIYQSLWSFTKQGLIGQWNKPQLLLSRKGSLPAIQKDCNQFACIIAWQKRTQVIRTDKQRNVRRSGTKIYLKWLLLDKQTRVWENLEAVNVPHNQQLLQLKILNLDANNLAVVWVAAVNKGKKINSHQLRLKILVRMRINGQWQKTVAVATLGDYGRVSGLGNLKVAAHSSRKIILSWNEKRETAELRSVYFDKQWFPASTVYRDNSDVSSLSAHFSTQGKATLIWQQKYGKNTHIFYSELNAKTNRWAAPFKLDRNPNSAILKNIVRNASDQIVAVWLKNFSRVQLAYIDKSAGLIQYLNITGQDFSVPGITLLHNKKVRFCWSRPKRSSYEIWVQQAEFKQLEGK